MVVAARRHDLPDGRDAKKSRSGVIGDAGCPAGVPVTFFLSAILLAPIGEDYEVWAADVEHLAAASVFLPVV